MEFSSLPLPPWTIAVAAGLLAAVSLWLWLRRRRARQPAARLRAAALDSLDHFLIPDGEGGEIHVDYALLSRERILLVDLREAAGHVFGSNAMQDWTVIGAGRRYTFSNPQPALYDRLAAVRRLLPDAPVEGLIVFGPQSEFSKGLPDHVRPLDELLKQLAAETAGGKVPPIELGEAWATLRRAAVETRVGHLIRG